MHPVLRALKAAYEDYSGDRQTRDFGYLIDAAQQILDEEETPKHFDEFWKLYPRKDGKDPARKAWKRAGGDIFWPDIKRNIQRRLAVKQWETTPERRQFIPMATTYLNQRRWIDVVPGNLAGDV